MHNDVLLAVDLEDPSSWQKALPAAVEACKGSNARLHILTVLPGYGMSIVGQAFPAEFEERAKQKAAVELKKFIADHVPSDIQADAIVDEGSVYDVIIQTSKRLNADLIIVAAHRPELKDYLLGPNAARVVRHADCSVLVVR